MFQVRAPRILSFEGSVTKARKDPSLRSGQALNIELLNVEPYFSARAPEGLPLDRRHA